MKKPIFLIGAIVWALVAAFALTVIIAELSGSGLPFLKGYANIFSVSDSKLVKEESLSLAGIDELSIGTYYHTIKITLVGGDVMTVRQYDMDSENLFTASKSGSRLSVGVAERGIVTIFGININPRLEVELPRDYLGSVALKTSSGSIRLNGGVEWSDTSLASTSGSINLEGPMVCDALEISSSSGSINAGALKAASVAVSSSSGTQRLGEISSSGAVTLKSSSGSINAERISASSCLVTASSGTIRLGDIAARDEISLESTSGSVNTGDLASNSVSVKSSSGTIRLEDVTAPGGLLVSSTSGSQNAGFVQAGTYRISTSSGTLRYDGLSGAGSVDTTSGSINCGSLDVRGDVAITSSSGTQRLTLAPEQSFELQISTTSGAIRADSLRLSYSDSRGKNAFGSVGGGEGGTLTIRSSSGSVNIDN